MKVGRKKNKINFFPHIFTSFLCFDCIKISSSEGSNFFVFGTLLPLRVPIVRVPFGTLFLLRMPIVRVPFGIPTARVPDGTFEGVVFWTSVWHPKRCLLAPFVFTVYSKKKFIFLFCSDKRFRLNRPR